jgi:uncharacterized protein YraI
MKAEQKSMNIGKILGLSALVIVGVIFIAWLVGALFGTGGTSTEGPAVVVPAPAPGVPTATTLDDLNVRSGPSTSYPSYGVAAKGSTGELIGVSESGSWWVVKMPVETAPDGQGWVDGRYVQVSNADNVAVIKTPPLPPTVEVPSVPIGAPKATSLDYINVRSGPGTQYESYGVAKPGVSAEIIGRSEDSKWWVIKLPAVAAGQGWVSADWVEAKNADGVPVIPAP